MAFESLSEKLQNVFKKLTGKGRLSADDVDAALKEVKIALLEADVNFKVVKKFVAAVKERAIGADVFSSLTPGQTVVKIVLDEMTKLLGSEAAELIFNRNGAMSVIMMCGLQGAGKTTTAAKLAAKLKSSGKRPLLVACDVYRPAAIKQLQVNGEKVGVPVFEQGNADPVQIAKAAVDYAEKNSLNVLILDTAGRLQIDDTLMAELENIKAEVPLDDILLTIDAMTGQEAVNVAATFHERLALPGVVLTKCDGDTRGGAALSVREVTGCPILYAAMGEKLTDLEKFYPDRFASRILGMGDVQTLIEKVEAQYDEEKTKELERKFKKADFDFNDYLEQFSQMKKMGGLGSIMKMLPGMGGAKANIPDIDEEQGDLAIRRVESIIYSMTNQERGNPDLLNPSRKKRIAGGAGVDIADVNRLVKQYEQSKKMMKQFSGMLSGKSNKRGGMRLPF